MKRLKKANRVFINSIEAFCACLCTPCGCTDTGFTCENSYCGSDFSIAISRGVEMGTSLKENTESSHYTLIANRADRGWGR